MECPKCNNGIKQGGDVVILGESRPLYECKNEKCDVCCIAIHYKG